MTTYLPPDDIIEGIPLLLLQGTVPILPRHVYVVCERPHMKPPIFSLIPKNLGLSELFSFEYATPWKILTCHMENKFHEVHNSE